MNGSNFPGIEFHDDYYKYSPNDSNLWLKMFELAEKNYPGELYSILMYVRNTGAVLIQNDEYGYIIRPVIGVNGWANQAEYEQERGCMAKYTQEILALLKMLRSEQHDTTHNS